MLRNYDAIGWMRQLNEGTAAVFANAWDVLTGDDPAMPSKTRFSNDHQNLSGENDQIIHNEQENMLPCVMVRDISRNAVLGCVCAFPISTHVVNFGPG